jgi:ribonuclease BN (tRNA processing enzyme)
MITIAMAAKSLPDLVTSSRADTMAQAPPIEISAGMKRSIAATGAPTEGDDMLEIMPLGAGSEVGRSCVLAKYKGKSVMFDCGVHPGYAGIASLPYFDEVDLSTVDCMLVTHFHLDHCAAVPFVVGHTNFRGRILMTHPTKAIFSMLMTDFVKLNKQSDSEALFTEADVKACMERIEVIDFHQEVRRSRFKNDRPRPRIRPARVSTPKRPERDDVLTTLALSVRFLKKITKNTRLTLTVSR